MTESGLSDTIEALRRYRFEIREIPYDQTVSGENGFVAVRDGVTVSYDGGLFIDNEEVQTPWGSFDLANEDHVNWFMQHFDGIATSIAHNHMSKHGSTDDSHPLNPEDSTTLSGEDKG